MMTQYSSYHVVTMHYGIICCSQIKPSNIIVQIIIYYYTVLQYLLSPYSSPFHTLVSTLLSLPKFFLEQASLKNNHIFSMDHVCQQQYFCMYIQVLGRGVSDPHTSKIVLFSILDINRI